LFIIVYFVIVLIIFCINIIVKFNFYSVYPTVSENGNHQKDKRSSWSW